MAYTFTVNDAIRRAKKKADMQNSNFMSQQDWIDTFNEAYTEWYDLMISTGENYFVAEDFITLASVTDYALPTDFYKDIAWDFEVNLNSNVMTTIKKYNNSERNNTVGNVSNIPSGRVRLTYYPIPTKFDDTMLTDAVASIAGYEKMIIDYMAGTALDNEESSSKAVWDAYERRYRRIQEAATERSLSEPSTVSDSYVEGNSLYHPTLRYRLYGDEVRFLTTTYVGV